MRTLQANGQYHLTKLGKAFFKDKYTEWLAHVPVIIRGRRRNGNPYERHDYLPVTALELGLSRQNDAWSEAQVARNVKEAVLRQLGQPEANEPIYMISGETYFLHPTNEWAYSSSMQVIDNRVTPRFACANPWAPCETSATSSSPETRFWPAPSRSAKTCSACLDN